MDFRQLEIFRAVMDSGSATAAARLLNLSQPAVSRQLSQIESELQVDLFIRGGGKLRPTADALALYDEATYAFEGIERVLNLADRMRGRDNGVLRLAAPYAFSEALLPQVVARMVESHRNLRYATEFGRYESIAAMVAKRQVDIGILKEPVGHPGIQTVPLLECGTVCVMREDHALARVAEVSVAQLARETLVLLGRDTAWRSDLQSLLRGQPRMPNVRIDTHSAAAVCAFVAQGLGVSVLPALVAAQFADKGLVLRPLTAAIRHRFVVASPVGLHASRLADEFALAAAEIARQLVERAMPGGAAGV
ncbi:MAG: LysR family transcriptional regulator [Proteobacteria bacterium]|nr:LysR family transcriptional regulator [Pseudomonadota bacterium]